MSDKVKVGENFERTIPVSCRTDWGWTGTKVDEYRAELGPKQRKLIYASKLKSRVRGDWEIHFGKRQRAAASGTSKKVKSTGR